MSIEKNSQNEYSDWNYLKDTLIPNCASDYMHVYKMLEELLNPVYQSASLITTEKETSRRNICFHKIQTSSISVPITKTVCVTFTLIETLTTKVSRDIVHYKCTNAEIQYELHAQLTPLKIAISPEVKVYSLNDIVRILEDIIKQPTSKNGQPVSYVKKVQHPNQWPK